MTDFGDIRSLIHERAPQLRGNNPDPAAMAWLRYLLRTYEGDPHEVWHYLTTQREPLHLPMSWRSAIGVKCRWVDCPAAASDGKNTLQGAVLIGGQVMGADSVSVRVSHSRVTLELNRLLMPYRTTVLSTTWVRWTAQYRDSLIVSYATQALYDAVATYWPDYLEYGGKTHRTQGSLKSTRAYARRGVVGLDRSSEAHAAILAITQFEPWLSIKWIEQSLPGAHVGEAISLKLAKNERYQK